MGLILQPNRNSDSIYLANQHLMFADIYSHSETYWVPQKLPQIYTVIVYICIEKVACFAVYICGNIWNAFKSSRTVPEKSFIILYQ